MGFEPTGSLRKIYSYIIASLLPGLSLAQSNFLVCAECGELFRCLKCSVTLTFHKKDNSTKCYYCGIAQEFENGCSGCGAEYIGRGLGTQKAEEQVKSILPDARIFVMDRDYTSGKTIFLDLLPKACVGRCSYRNPDGGQGT